MRLLTAAELCFLWKAYTRFLLIASLFLDAFVSIVEGSKLLRFS